MIAALALAAALNGAPLIGPDCPPLRTPKREEFGQIPRTTLKPPRDIPMPRGKLADTAMMTSGGCLMSVCASYVVTIWGDGAVTYWGDGAVLVQGDHSFNIPARKAACLVEQFRRAQFWGLDDVYDPGVMDASGRSLRVDVAGESKNVEDVEGILGGMPLIIVALENEVTRLGADHFITGDLGTIRDLKRDGFKFGSTEGRDMLARAAQLSPDEVVLALIAEGAAVDGQAKAHDFKSRSTLEAAVMRGRLKVVRALVAKGAGRGWPQDKLDGLLFAGIRSHYPEVLRELVALHPDLDAKDEEGQTLDEIADNPRAISVLSSLKARGNERPR